jgi:predicted nucleotidyltransferase
VLKHFQREGMTSGSPAALDAMAEYDLHRCVIYRCIVGSRAYGLDHADSDTDRRGVYLPPAEMHWSLFGVPEQLENQETDECYWELQKFLTLALKANPNVLEVLHTPIVEYVTPLAQELMDMRAAFLSKLVYQTYNGYVMSQFKKLDQDIRGSGAIKWKHAMHLVRLLLSGITVLRERTVPVAVAEHKDRLVAIRNGLVPWEEVNAWRLELHRQFDEAFRTTSLPDRPDYEAANAFLVKARRSMVR